MLRNIPITIAATWTLVFDTRSPAIGLRRKAIFRTPSTNAGVCYLSQDPSNSVTSGLALYPGDSYLDEIDNSGYIYQGAWYVAGTAADVLKATEEIS